MSLLIMSTNSSPQKDRLSPSWIRRSISWRRSSTTEVDSRPSTSSGLLSPQPLPSRSNSDDSKLARSNSPVKNASFREIVNRLRSSSSASSLGAQSQEAEFSDIHDWFHGFRRYNQLVTTQISQSQTYDSSDFSKTMKPITKNCGGQLIHGLPEAAFDFALLWCPVGELSRRDANEPTWSWTAFNGPVNFPFDVTTCPDLYTAPKSEGGLFRSEITNFHIGPADAAYTIRREKNASMRTKYPPYFHAPRGSDSSVESNTLRFTAFTIPADGFTIEQLHYEKKNIPVSQLIDAQDRHCGIIMDSENALSEPCSTGPFEFVLLSRNLHRAPHSHTRKPANPTIHPPGTPIWDGERFVWDQEVMSFDENVFEVGDWKVLNVMLIKWDGDVAERVAVGRLHEDVWVANEPVRKDVVLR